MKTLTTQNVLAEVWEAKDSLSIKFGHNLHATCQAIYAEQQKHPEDFINLGATLVKRDIPNPRLKRPAKDNSLNA